MPAETRASKVTKPKAKRPTSTQNKKYLKSINKLAGFNEIEQAIRKAFQNAQNTVSVHKREVAVLKTIQLRSLRLGFSKQFNDLFIKMVNKILPLKKNEPVGDRIIKFVTSFVNAINPPERSDEDEDDDEETEEEAMFSEFIDKLARHLVEGFQANDKNVRYRVCHLLSHIMHYMTALDEELYETLSDSLLVKLYDREAQIRMKAVTTMASFQEEDFSTKTSDAAKKLRFVMQNDSNAEVRRACITQIEKTKHTKFQIFERARDINPINRKIVYSKVLPEYPLKEIEPVARQKLLSWGLKDRDENVRKAASKWFTDTWFKQCNNSVLQLLTELDVLDSDIADVAVRTFLDSIKDPSTLEFKEEHFNSLTPEYALLIRIFFEFCNDNDMANIIDNSFPVASTFADMIENYTHKQLDLAKKYQLVENNLPDEDGKMISVDDLDDERYYDFIVIQLLKIAVDYDYSDGFGRNKMMTVLRNALEKEAALNNPLITEYLLKCLRNLSINERDFSQMIVELINDLKDTAYDAKHPPQEQTSKLDKSDDEDEDDDDDDDDDSFYDARTELSRTSVLSANRSMEHELKQVEELEPEVIINCLNLAQRMLQLIKDPLKDNMYILSLLDSLIHPSVRRSETEIRILGVKCLGLCCVLDRELAGKSMFLFGVIISKSESDDLAVTGLKGISDLLAVHGVSILETGEENSVDSVAIAKLFYRALRDYSRKEVQAAAGEAIFKLFLCGVINDDELYETTLLTYFNPKIEENEALKQCFSFCIPAYSFSRASHQQRVVRIVCDTLYRTFDSMENAEDNTDALSPKSILDQLLYWTDPYNIINRDDEDSKFSPEHADVALQLLDYLSRVSPTRENKEFIKAVFKVLPDLHFSEYVGLEKLREISLALENDEILGGELDEGLKMTNCQKSYDKFISYVDFCIEKAESLEAENQESENKEKSQSRLLVGENANAGQGEDSNRQSADADVESLPQDAPTVTKKESQKENDNKGQDEDEDEDGDVEMDRENDDSVVEDSENEESVQKKQEENKVTENKDDQQDENEGDEEESDSDDDEEDPSSEEEEEEDDDDDDDYKE
ncbi:unnamed protein product [Ambrosiozyma monospora]|uniref:Unnamed protein product n=1 Tax=Ambrosiozyma monospora TaxID=43982 RepID=A0A9W6YR16_AMBMO|nr:unnamed protein product [Ambrosiozyma monospora]